MEFKIIENNGVKTAIVCMINNCLVHDSESALDLIVNAKYSTGCYNIAISKALKDLIYECNNGNDFFFAENENEAVTMLIRSIESR